jgi:hypothetical protein
MLLRADAAHVQEATLLQSREFALHGPRTAAGEANQLRRVKAAVGLSKKQAQNALLRRGKQSVGKTALSMLTFRDPPRYTHFGHVTTQFGYKQRR